MDEKYLEKVSKILEKPYFENMVLHYGVNRRDEQVYVLSKLYGVPVNLSLNGSSIIVTYEYKRWIEQPKHDDYELKISVTNSVTLYRENKRGGYYENENYIIFRDDKF